MHPPKPPMPPQEKPGYLHLTRSQNPRRFERWCAIAHQRQPTRRASRRLPLSRSRVPPRGGRLAAVVVAIAATAALTAPVVVAATPAAVVPRRAPAAVVVTPPAPAVVITPAAAAAAVALVVARALAVALTERRHVATPAHLDLDRVLHLTQPLLARLLLAEDVEALLVAVDRFVVEEHEGAEAGLELAERGAARAEHEPDGRLRHVDRGEVVALLERREVNVHLPVIPLLQRDLYAHPREAPLLLPANNCDLSPALRVRVDLEPRAREVCEPLLGRALPPQQVRHLSPFDGDRLHVVPWGRAPAAALLSARG
mmetsp:Transcript_34671/g.81050  ORF Transcript_34671/g.81050 Transcript_34671/m.81050 type:complete len:313 (-) Transcript_34671:45-983(-)